MRIAVVAVFVSGCSWFTHGPAYAPQTCNASRLAPAWDTYSAASGVVTALVAADLFEDEADLARIGVAFGLTYAAVHGAAAAYGFRHARACRELRNTQPIIEMQPTVIEAPPIVIEEAEETTTTTRTKRTIVIP